MAFVLAIAALVCLILAALNVNLGRVSLGWGGLALWLASTLV